jgi:hypothetical protein
MGRHVRWNIHRLASATLPRPHNDINAREIRYTRVLDLGA